MSNASRFFKTTGLLGIVAALAFLNWQLWNETIDIGPLESGNDSSAATSQAATPPAKISPLVQPPLANFRETIERPLFNATRRPIVIQQAAAPPPEPKGEPPPPPPTAEPSGLKLVGVMSSGQKSQRALIRPEGKPYGTWVDVGGEIEGWRLARVESNRVLIEKSGGKEELLLRAPGR